MEDLLLLFLDQNFKMKVVILAGGFGTRLSEYTDRPKPMVPIGNLPMIHHIINIYKSWAQKNFTLP